MASNVSTNYASVFSSTPTNRRTEVISHSGLIDNSQQIIVNKDLMQGIIANGVPVKFADNLLSVLVRDQVTHLLSQSEIKRLRYSDEEAARTLTYEITEMLKRIVEHHVNENYKVVIQVMTYPKHDENSITIMSRSLWNFRTDDVLSVEAETDAFRFLIVMHGVAV